jgi:hypothetical protein
MGVEMKKYQIFVSSTYNDLLSERQAVVEAILRAGHIPAGMELFATGDKSQLETIRRWIDESDLFMLILGRCYGTVEEETGKSYTQLEYEYALERGKPVFAAVISEQYRETKVRNEGDKVMEAKHPDLYQSFLRTVKSRMCRFFDDKKDLKLIVHESIPEVTRDHQLAGWVRGSDVMDPQPMLEEMAQLRAENNKLLRRTTELEKRLDPESYQGYTFDELFNLLTEERIWIEKIPGVSNESKEISLLSLLGAFADHLVVGVENSDEMDSLSQFLFFKLSPKLAIYGLVEKKNVNNTHVQRFQLTTLGNRFLAKVKPLFHQQPKVGNSRR